MNILAVPKYTDRASYYDNKATCTDFVPGGGYNDGSVPHNRSVAIPSKRATSNENVCATPPNTMRCFVRLNIQVRRAQTLKEVGYFLSVKLGWVYKVEANSVA